VAREAAFHSRPAADVETLLAAERKTHGEVLEVMLALHANEHRFDDLGRPTSIWRVALVSEAGEVVASAIERVQRPDASLVALYPFFEPFWTGYRLRFPRELSAGGPLLPAGAKKVTLRLSSAVGKVELPYDLEAGSAGAPWP
jgi:hypothetical protein